MSKEKKKIYQLSLHKPDWAVLTVQQCPSRPTPVRHASCTVYLLEIALYINLALKIALSKRDFIWNHTNIRLTPLKLDRKKIKSMLYNSITLYLLNWFVSIWNNTTHNYQQSPANAMWFNIFRLWLYKNRANKRYATANKRLFRVFGCLPIFLISVFNFYLWNILKTDSRAQSKKGSRATVCLSILMTQRHFSRSEKKGQLLNCLFFLYPFYSNCTETSINF